MANLNGFIKVHRKLIEWGWYSDVAVRSVFMHLLLVATFKESQYMGYKLKPGQSIIGRKKMADDLGLSEQQVRTALKKLESTGEITLFSTNRFTIATVENWTIYQGDEIETNQQITNKQPTDNQQITNKQPHLKNVKNVNKVKNVKNNIFIPPTLDEVRAYCNERPNNVDPDRFINFYESKGWMVGKNKMKDWKAAIRSWEKSEQSKPKQEKGRLDWIDEV